MELITLRTVDGRYWRALGGAIELAPEPIMTSLFSMESVGDGAVVLSALSGGLVVARLDSVTLVRPDSGARATRLRIVERGDVERALVVVDDGRDVRAQGQTVFTIETLNLPSHGCCGPTRRPLREQHGRDVRKWKDIGHQGILSRGVQLLAGVRTLPNVQLFLDRFWSGPRFSKELSKALREADEEAPFADGLFGYHFCEPNSMQTFWGTLDHSWRPFNAISEGQRYFYLSIHLARRIVRLGKQAGPDLFAACGYYLGLSLHFLTDLTQPMHAANFTNILGDWPWNTDAARSNPLVMLADWRHASFESHGDKLVKRGYLNDVTLDAAEVSDVALNRYQNVGELFREVAKNSSDIWFGLLQRIVETKDYIGATWGPESDLVFERSLKPAPRIVAKFFTLWSRMARQDLALDDQLRDDTWYRIKEPTKSQYIGAQSGLVSRMAGKGEPDRTFIDFLPDGSCAFGSQEHPELYWTMAGGGEGNPLQALPLAKAAGEAGFRLTPVGSRAWIYIARQIRGGRKDGDQALTVNPEDGAVEQQIPQLGPMRPSDSVETQLFEFEQDGRMTDEERAAIATKRPTVDAPWWGFSAAPQWRAWDRDALKLTAASGVAVASRASGDLVQVVVAGSVLYIRQYFGVWGDWKRVELEGRPIFSGPIAATAWGRNHIEVFAPTTTGEIVRATLESDNLDLSRTSFAPAPLQNVQRLAALGGPAGHERLEVYAITTEGQLLKTDFDPTGDRVWKNWVPIPGHKVQPQFGLGVAASSAGRYVVTAGADRQVHLGHSTRYGQWDWTSAGDAGIAPRAAMISTASQKRIDVLVLGNDGSLRQRTRIGTAWGEWTDLGPAGMPLFSATAVAWGPSHIQVFALGAEGQLSQRIYQ